MNPGIHQRAAPVDPSSVNAVSKAVQSLFVLAVRAAIMLLFLIAVPLVAIFGRATPEVVRLAAKRYLPEEFQKLVPQDDSQPDGSNEAASRSPAPPLYTPDSDFALPRKVSPTSSNSEHAAPSQPVPVPQPLVDVQPSSVVPAYPSMLRPEVPPLANNDVHGQLPPAMSGPPVHTVDPQTARTMSLEEMERQFQQLGATWYRLEQWGQEDQYRFSLLAEVSPNLPAKRHFEAVTTSKEQALAEVLEQLQAWRNQVASR